MTGDEANEVLGIVQRICPAVLSSAISPRGNVGTALRRAVGMMKADKNMIDIEVFSFAMNVCLDLARHSGATLVSMDRVRKQVLTETPISIPAILTVQAIVRLTLAMESRIIAYMVFKSRNEADDVASLVHTAFSEAAEVAADDLDAGGYRVLIELHGAVTQHLAARGRQLPRVITYGFTQVMPALRMAQRAYADPKRYAELIAENNVVHPAFMPRDGKMLAV
jgi:hypothetical protein